MPLPKLTPLQSRFAACLGTSVLLFIIYYSVSLFPSHFAYAAELDSIHNQDHNHHRIAREQEFALASETDWGDDENVEMFEGTAEYQADFVGLGRDIIGRALLDTFALQNNIPNSLNVGPGETRYYVFENSSVWGEHASWRSGLPSNISRGDQDVISKRDAEGIQILEDAVGMEESSFVRRQTGGTTRAVFISVNTCLQPSPQGGQTDPVPQLTLYVSLTDQNPKPGPAASADLQTAYPLVEGYGAAQLNATGNVYIAVAAPNATSNSLSGDWNYVVAASIDASYYYYNDTTSFLWTIDTDSTSALVATYNLTSEDDTDETMALRKEWMATPLPFSMFVYNQSDPKVNGIRNSFCGLQKLDSGSTVVETNMTERGMGSNPKQQFYVHELIPGQNYTGVLAYNGVNRTADSGANVVGGGGQLWQAMDFTTKIGKTVSSHPSFYQKSNSARPDGNCRVIFDLPFCTDVAYAVPTNPFNSSLSSAQILAQTYDNYTQLLYKNFDFSLQQIPCNTTNSAQYSLARTCDDCARDYKTWLCAVTIPRCTDFSTPAPYLVPRNVGQKFANGTQSSLSTYGLNDSLSTSFYSNSSRNPLIDTHIKPGPYRELLPCKELCYDMVQSCPMAMGFACPGGRMLARSYGDFDRGSIAKEGAGAVTCNYLGVDWPTLSAATAVRPGLALGFAMFVMALFVLGW